VEVDLVGGRLCAGRPEPHACRLSTRRL
jgi:hypothetical protein